MKKFLLSALFALSLFCNRASAQNYKLFVALTNPDQQYVDLKDVQGFQQGIIIPESANPAAFSDSVLQGFRSALDLFGPEFINVPVAPGVSFKEVMLNHPHIPGVLVRLANWESNGVIPAEQVVSMSEKIYFSKVDGPKTFLADYEINDQGVSVAVGVRIKKINLND